MSPFRGARRGHSRGVSSAGRASRWQREGQGFEPLTLHQRQGPRVSDLAVFAIFSPAPKRRPERRPRPPEAPPKRRTKLRPQTPPRSAAPKPRPGRAQRHPRATHPGGAQGPRDADPSASVASGHGGRCPRRSRRRYRAQRGFRTPRDLVERGSLSHPHRERRPPRPRAARGRCPRGPSGRGSGRLREDLPISGGQRGRSFVHRGHGPRDLRDGPSSVWRRGGGRRSAGEHLPRGT